MRAVSPGKIPPCWKRPLWPVESIRRGRIVVTVDMEQCNACGVCWKRFGGYCLGEHDGKPVIDYAVCNMCQKCIALCPRGALLMNGRRPDKIKGGPVLDADTLERFLERRRSIKRFKDRPLPRELLERIAVAASYAPNQNKNINILIIDDPDRIRRVFDKAHRSTRRWYRFLYTPHPLALLARLIIGKRQYLLLKRKMEYKSDDQNRPRALIMVYGDPRVPVTAPSAPFLLSHMLLMAESLGVGSTLMDALKHAFNLSPALKRDFSLPRGSRVFGVLALGYANEKIVNIPRGYRAPVFWNEIGNQVMDAEKRMIFSISDYYGFLFPYIKT